MKSLHICLGYTVTVRECMNRIYEYVINITTEKPAKYTVKSIRGDEFSEEENRLIKDSWIVIGGSYNFVESWKQKGNQLFLVVVLFLSKQFDCIGNCDFQRSNIKQIGTAIFAVWKPISKCEFPSDSW